MEIVAGNSTQNGTVFVFNESSRDVREYRVFTEMIDTRPRTWVTEVVERNTPVALKAAYANFVGVMETLEADGYELPPEFPIASVAGAVGDPTYFGGQFSFLIESGEVLSAGQFLAVFLESWANQLIPLANFGDIMGPETILVIFSDGSSVRVSYRISEDAMGGPTTLLVDGVLLLTARDPNGNAIPSATNASSWDGFSMTGSGNAVREWMDRARAAGVVVRGSASGSASFATVCSTTAGVETCWIQDVQ